MNRSETADPGAARQRASFTPRWANVSYQAGSARFTATRCPSHSKVGEYAVSDTPS